MQGKEAEVCTLVCVPHPALSADQCLAVEREFAMQSGELHVTLRCDEVFYFRKQYIAEKKEKPPEKLLIEKT